jgi:hypothetical protein
LEFLQLLYQFKKLGAKILRQVNALVLISSLHRSRFAPTSARTTTCWESPARWRSWLKRLVCREPLSDY